MFPQGTTPTFTLTLPTGYDLSQAKSVVASFVCCGVKVEKRGEQLSVNANEVSVRLEQEDTLPMICGEELAIQLNWLYSDGTRGASEVYRTTVTEQLLQEVMR